MGPRVPWVETCHSPRSRVGCTHSTTEVLFGFPETSDGLYKYWAVSFPREPEETRQV